MNRGSLLSLVCLAALPAIQLAAQKADSVALEQEERTHEGGREMDRIPRPRIGG